jgi:hypothetical protein
VDLRGRKWQEAGEDCAMRSFITCMVDENVVRVFVTRQIRWGSCSMYGKVRNVFKVLIAKPEGKRLMGE